MAVTEVCCTCLAFNVEMFSLADVEIRGYFEKAISNIKMDPEEEFMQNVCGECLLLMKKYVKFKETCREANQRLRQLSIQSPYISEAQLITERGELNSEPMLGSDEIPMIPDTNIFVKNPIVPHTISFDKIPSIPDTKASLLQNKQEDSEDESASNMDFGNQGEYYKSEDDPNIHGLEYNERLAKSPPTMIFIVQEDQYNSDVKDDVFAVNCHSIKSSFSGVEESQSQKKSEPLQAHKDDAEHHIRSYENEKLKGPIWDPKKHQNSDIQDDLFDENSHSMESNSSKVKESPCQKESEPVQTHKDAKHSIKSYKNKKLRGPMNQNTLLMKEKQALRKIVDYAVQVTLTEEQQKEELLKSAVSENYLNAPFKCSHCVKGFISKERFDRHSEIHKRPGVWHCDICKVCVCSLYRLRIHRRSHEIRYKCLRCGKLTTTPNRAAVHEKRHHLGFKFECKHCDAKFKNQELYKLHTRTAHPTDYVCDLCGDYFTSQERLDIHKNTKKYCRKSPLIVFECKTCDIQFLKFRLWYRHMLKHAHEKGRNPPAECLICRHKNTSWHDWRNHILSEHRYSSGRNNPTVKFICDVCGKTLCNITSLSHHMRSRHNNPIAKRNEAKVRTQDTCKVCDLVILRDNMRRHMLTHTKFPCDFCGKRFVLELTRDDHVKSEHRVMGSSEANKGAAANAEPSILQETCKVCNKNIRRENMKRHMWIHTGEKPFECNFCGKSFNQANSRNNHVRNVHRIKVVSEKQNVQKSHHFQCRQCPKKFQSRQGLEAHEGLHTGVKPVSCDICKRSFYSKKTLACHLMIHTGEKPFSCDMCERSYARKGSLANHRITHTEARSHLCEICHRTFKTKHTLKSHQQVHTREYIYECDFCQRKFTTKPYLTSHLQIHTGEMSFECDICNKKFNHISNLRRHVIGHTGAKNWKCDLCGKSFTQSSGLKLHTNSVHLKLPYPPRKPRKKK